MRSYISLSYRYNESWPSAGLSIGFLRIVTCCRSSGIIVTREKNQYDYADIPIHHGWAYQPPSAPIQSRPLVLASSSALMSCRGLGSILQSGFLLGHSCFWLFDIIRDREALNLSLLPKQMVVPSASRLIIAAPLSETSPSAQHCLCHYAYPITSTVPCSRGDVVWRDRRQLRVDACGTKYSSCFAFSILRNLESKRVQPD